MNPKNFFESFKSTQVKQGLAGLAFLFFGYHFKKTIYYVEPGYMAIKFNILTGVGNKTFKEGYHLALPLFERPIIFDCRMNNYLQNTIVGTKDLQIVTFKTRVICRPRVDALQDLYRTLGKDFDTRALNSIIPEICGVSVSQFNAAQIVAQRDQISNVIRQRITEKAREFFIDVDDVAIIEIKFSKDFTDAIEKKQVAQQEAMRYKFYVDEALESKKSTIIKALGEAESVQKFGEANQNSNAFLTLKRLETAKNISKILKDSKNRVLLDSNAFFLNLPIQSEKK